MADVGQRLKLFAEALLNQEQARIIVPANEDARGFWFGGGNMIEDASGNLYLSGRYRNFGDSRTGLDLGDRGLELAIFKSEDKGRNFNKIKSIYKKDLPGEILSIEGTALHYDTEGVIELFLSSEKKENTYPEHLQEFLKEGTGIWSIDVISADKPEHLNPKDIRPVISCSDPRFIHIKDPFVYNSYTGEQYLLFCTHPFNWSSSNTGYLKRKRGQLDFEPPVFNFFERGFTWDVAMTRGTCIVDIPQIGILKDTRISLLFYDGGECVRAIDEHHQAVKRPRGYSCEELGGLAYIENGNINHIERISKELPLFLSPYGTACSRYVDILTTKDGMYAVWQQSQKGFSQPLVMNFLSYEEISSILS